VDIVVGIVVDTVVVDIVVVGIVVVDIVVGIVVDTVVVDIVVVGIVVGMVAGIEVGIAVVEVELVLERKQFVLGKLSEEEALNGRPLERVEQPPC